MPTKRGTERVVPLYRRRATIAGLADRRPWTGTAADLFIQAQFPLHSGRILGTPGRILISFMGLATAALSVTGVVIWYRKRRARVRAAYASAYSQARAS